jgi:type IV pilus assembly protein PilC
VFTYVYRARDWQGKLVSGTVKAESLQQAVQRIRDKEYFLIEIKERSDSRIIRNVWNIGYGSSVKTRELSVFCRQMATLLKAGLPLLTSLQILKGQTSGKVFQLALAGVEQSLQEGSNFSDALQQYPGVFPRLMASMVEAGELVGLLDKILEQLAEHFENELKLREKIVGAITYPLIVLMLSFFLLLFLFYFLLPVFANMLHNLQLPLPFATEAVLQMGNFLQNYWYVFPLAVTLLIFGGIKALKTPEGGLWGEKFFLLTPVLGPLARKIIIVRFCRILGLLLQGGVPLLQSLQMAHKSSSSRILAEAFEAVQSSIRGGSKLADPLRITGIFPSLVLEMIAIGEETGSLEDFLAKISELYEQEVSSSLDRLSTLLEPILILLVGVILGFVIVSIFLPILTLLNGL